MKKKVSIIVEARMNSTRLPGKVLKNIIGKTVIELLLNRLKSIKKIDKIIIATTKNSKDDLIEEFANKKKFHVYRGDENNVMQRVMKAAEYYNTDIIVSITGDCPLIDPEIVDQAINLYKNNKAKYVSNCHIRSYPDGMDVQVYSLNTLKKSYKMTKSLLDREHVTLHIRKNPNIFPALHLIAPRSLFWPNLGLTLDDKLDFILIKKIFEKFKNKKNNFSLKEIIDYLKNNKKLLKINHNVKRK